MPHFDTRAGYDKQNKTIPGAMLNVARRVETASAAIESCAARISSSSELLDDAHWYAQYCDALLRQLASLHIAPVAAPVWQYGESHLCTCPHCTPGPTVPPDAEQPDLDSWEEI